MPGAPYSHPGGKFNMVPKTGRKRIVIGSLLGVVALLALLAFTGPSADREISGVVQRTGGPCLNLERWGLFGWTSIGNTNSLPQATRGEWDAVDTEAACNDITDSVVLVRMPTDTEPGVYRICGTADALPCLTVRVVPFESDGPGP